ncbi:MAG TPA: EamA family transporter [Terriglobales bacterium]
MTPPIPTTSDSGPSTSARHKLLGYLSLCLIWGSTWLAIRFLVEDIPALEGAAIRFMAGGFLLLFMALVQRRRWPRDGRVWNAIGVLSITIMAVPYGLLFWAEQHIASSMTAVLFSAMPLVVSLLTPVMTSHKVPRNAVFALVIACGGLVALFFTTELNTTRPALLGGAAVLIAMVLSGWSVVYAKKRLDEVDPVVSTAMQLLLGSAALWWGVWVFEGRRHPHWTPTSLAALAFLTIFGSCVAFVVYYWLLKHMQPYQLSTISLVVPLIAVSEGALLGHERIPLMMLAVMAVVLVSVGAVLRGEALSLREDDLLLLRGRIR